MLAAVRQFLPLYGLGSAAVIARGLRTETVIRPPGAGELYIGHLGVNPTWRGQGIGEALIDHLMQQGAKAGLRRAVLDVATNNPRAEALYTRLGFRVTAERPSSLRRAAGFVPSHRRMERAI
jgi:ribosomal protein S18 acetylase RimI-like enzyme